jgi:hypothetical protein
MGEGRDPGRGLFSANQGKGDGGWGMNDESTKL